MTELDRVRTDVVGSLLRPAAWKEARLRFETGLLPADEFSRMENGLVKANLALQEAVGLDVFSVGEHYRRGHNDSATPVLLAAIATATERIRLGTSVTVLSTNDPVRLYHEFSTLDAVSNGRACIA